MLKEKMPILFIYGQRKTLGTRAVPKWNFHKILINKQGKIEDTYSSFTKPMSKKLISKIEEIL
jgi:glutathione peroxidase